MDALPDFPHLRLPVVYSKPSLTKHTSCLSSLPSPYSLYRRAASRLASVEGWSALIASVRQALRNSRLPFPMPAWGPHRCYLELLFSGVEGHRRHLPVPLDDIYVL